jgi:arabinose-5-phosphate isomerase
MDANLKSALVEMTEKKLGMTTIVDKQGVLVGIFTDGDVRRTLDKNADIQTTRIDSIMAAHPKTIDAHILAAEALGIMEKHKITSLVVVDKQNKPVGIIHIHDLLRAGVV